MSWNSRTNIISTKWFNHNGWIDIFVIKETYFFCSYFRHISLCFYSNSERESLLDAEFNSRSNEYPHCILLTDPANPKIRNTWKNVMMMSTSSPDRNLSKNTMRYVENTNKKSSFFNDKYVNSTIMVDLFYWNSIGSWIPTHKNLFWHVLL